MFGDEFLIRPETPLCHEGIRVRLHRRASGRVDDHNAFALTCRVQQALDLDELAQQHLGIVRLPPTRLEGPLLDGSSEPREQTKQDGHRRSRDEVRQHVLGHDPGNGRPYGNEGNEGGRVAKGQADKDRVNLASTEVGHAHLHQDGQDGKEQLGD